MQDFVAQLAHEKGDSEDRRQQELEEAEHKNTLLTIQEQGENALKLEQADIDQQIQDIILAHELERRIKTAQANKEILETYLALPGCSDVSSLLKELKKIGICETLAHPEDYMIHGSRFRGNKLLLKWNDYSFVLLGMKSMKLGRNRNMVDLVIRTTEKDRNITVSRHHTTISSEQNRVYISDMSSYGTWVNGKKVQNNNREELTQEDSVVQFGDICWNMHMQLCESGCKNVCRNCKKEKVKCLTFDRCDGIKEKYLMICQCCDLGRVIPELKNWDIFFRDGSFFIRDLYGECFYLSPGNPVVTSGQRMDVAAYEI